MCARASSVLVFVVDNQYQYLCIYFKFAEVNE